MKILWLSHIVPFPPKAGVLQRCYNMLNESAKYHDIDLLTFVQKEIFLQIYEDPAQGLNEAESFLKSICGNVCFVPIESENSFLGSYWLAIRSLFTKNPYTINWLKSKIYLQRLRCLINDNNYDLIYFDTISLMLYLDEIGAKPSILDHHNIESHLLLRRGPVGEI